MAYHVSLTETPCKNPDCTDPLCFAHWDRVRARIAAEDAADGAQCQAHTNPFHGLDCRDCDADYLYAKDRNSTAYRLFTQGPDAHGRRAHLEEN